VVQRRKVLIALPLETIKSWWLRFGSKGQGGGWVALERRQRKKCQRERGTKMKKPSLKRKMKKTIT